SAPSLLVFPSPTLFRSPLQRFLADEIRLLVQVDHPLVVVADLERVGVQRDVAAVGEHACLDPPDVTRADHLHAVPLTDLPHPVRSEEHTSELQSRENLV